ncbi:tudor domain-containing protein 1 [Rhizophagus clarus]|uniref:Tudor domain-containing protein 1 n=1 Tax=Rhizophagus clarus TaxID=94130 RepID=A0A8H3LAU4_9GLOM|nr:tudor domain-containing protein 1 [Rhizophagus clarus]
MNNCYVCKKFSKTRCANCHTTYYCSKECQRKDWKEHKKSCKILPVNEILDKTDDYEEIFNETDDDDDETDDEELSDLLSNIMLLQSLKNASNSIEDLLLLRFLMNAGNSMEDLKIPNFGREYAMKYPYERERIQFLNSAKSALNGHQMIDETLNNNVKGQFRHTVKRWNDYSKELKDFLSCPRKMGDIFTKKTKHQYNIVSGGGYAQSFSNMPKQSLSFDQGKVHVAVGFVDLDFLLRARIVKTMNSVEKPNKFIGYEGSVYAVAKTNVIKEMMIGKAPIRSIIEVWFSSVWTMKTLKHFEDAVKEVLQYGNAPNDGPPNPTKNELHPRVRSLISHWNKSVKSPKSRQEAHKLWKGTFDFEDGLHVISLLANFLSWMINIKKI